MKRLRRILLCVAVLSTSACGVLRDTVAATVNGHEISVSEVQRLATQLSKDPTASSGLAGGDTLPGTRQGDAERRALVLIVQRELLASALRARNGEVTDADRSSAAGETKDLGELQAFASDYVSLVAALTRLAKAELPEPTSAAIAEYYAAHPGEFVAKTCVDGLVADQAEAEAVYAVLNAGAPFGDFLASHPTTSKFFTRGVNQCLTPTDAANDQQAGQILERLAEAQVGSVTALQSQQGSVIFFRVTSREVAPLASPSTVAAVSAKVKASQQDVAAAKAEAVLGAAQRSATVSVDPRFGTWDPTTRGLVIAPPAPTTTIAPRSTAVPTPTSVPTPTTVPTSSAADPSTPAP